jgi:hypothetical protein
MIRKKPFILIVVLLILQLLILCTFGYWVFSSTESIIITILSMLVLTTLRFSTHISLFIKCKRLLMKALCGVPYNRFDEVSIPDKATWLDGTISLNKRFFQGGSFVTDGYLYLITWLLLPRPVLQLAWSDIAQIRVASPVRAIVYFKSHTKVELTVPWQSSYEAYVPKTVGYKKDTSYRYKN